MDPLKRRKLRSTLSPATPPTPHQLNKLLTTVISNGQKCHFKVMPRYVCCSITLRKWIFCSFSCFFPFPLFVSLFIFQFRTLTMWPKMATRRFLSFGPKKRQTDPDFSPFYSGLPGKCYNSTSYRTSVTSFRNISNSYSPVVTFDATQF